MAPTYYNENDPRAAAWLRENIQEGLIPDGDVDERDIRDVAPRDLEGFRHVHLFAGIGGWAYALRLAQWRDDRPVWTGSCPCQPFSSAGKRKGTGDARHLWPAFRWLVAQRRPPVVLGEQVASPLGREWLAGVRADLEAMGYAVGAADLCAASVGAPHRRQRLWWVADAIGGQCDGVRIHLRSGESRQNMPQIAGNGETGWLGDAEGERAGEEPGVLARARPESDGGGANWVRARWILCDDDTCRRIPVEPALFPLAHGLPGRVGLLRGAGNAIVPQLAAQFIAAAVGLIGGP